MICLLNAVKNTAVIRLTTMVINTNILIMQPYCYGYTGCSHVGCGETWSLSALYIMFIPVCLLHFTYIFSYWCYSMLSIVIISSLLVFVWVPVLVLVVGEKKEYK